MENITNPILDSSPPFEISSGGDSVSNSFTKYQKQIYNDALNYATSKNDKDPKAFANKAALDSVVTHGSNNPFGDIATKTETGVIKNGIKYKNYNDILQPLSKKYDEFLINEHNTQLEQNAIVAQNNQVDNEMQQQQQVQQEQSPNIPQSVDMTSMGQPIINQNQPVELPQQTTSLDVVPQQIDKQQADQMVLQKNNIDQTMMNNPIQNQQAYGGEIDPSKNKIKSKSGTSVKINNLQKSLNTGLDWVDPQTWVSHLTPNLDENGIFKSVLKDRHMPYSKVSVTNYLNKVKDAFITNVVLNKTGKAIGNPELNDVYDKFQIGTSAIRAKPSQVVTQIIGSKLPNITGNLIDSVIDPWSEQIDNSLNKSIKHMTDSYSKSVKKNTKNQHAYGGYTNKYDHGGFEDVSDLGDPIKHSHTSNSNTAILNLQKQLVKSGHLKNSDVDGIMGPITEKAYSNFEKDNSGLFGKNLSSNILPLNINALTNDLTGIKNSISRKTLSSRELSELQNIVRKNLKKGKNTIEYNDYNTGSPYNDVGGNESSLKTLTKLGNPNYNLKTTLGQANILTKKNGDTLVVDSYDFNDGGAKDKGLAKFMKQSIADPSMYNISRKAGSNFGSSNGEGAPVIINTRNKMAYGGYSGNSYEGSGNLNSFNVGNTHENNPNGGIPLGVGNNGKQNTVEQGETSVDINGKKFIFSNRIII